MGDPDDPRITCVELEVEHEDLTREEIRVRDVKYAILGDIPDMGKARLVRVRRLVKEVELDR